MTRKVRNVPASIHARLLALANRRGVEFNRLLERYVFERFLYRLSLSDQRAELVLKGALLFVGWPGATDRATRDMDFLGMGSPEPHDVADRIRRICATTVSEDDGVVFDTASVAASQIRQMAQYGGVRVRITAMLGHARIPVQLDVGFGDAVTPGPVDLTYPVLLGHSAPSILAYPLESVVAEKLEAIVAYGIVNSRLKDYYDLWMLAGILKFDGSVLVRAVTATFQRRGTPLVASIPDGLADEFFSETERGRLWRAFLHRSRILDAPEDFSVIGETLRSFLLPLMKAASRETPLPTTWREGGWGGIA